MGNLRFRVKHALFWQTNLAGKDKVLLQEFAVNYAVIITKTTYLTPIQLLADYFKLLY